MISPCDPGSFGLYGLMKSKVRVRARTVPAGGFANADYGMSDLEIRSVAANLRAKAKRAIKTGKARSFNGDIEKTIR